MAEEKPVQVPEEAPDAQAAADRGTVNPKHPPVEGPESPLEDARHPEEAPEQAREALEEEAVDLRAQLDEANARAAEAEAKLEAAAKREGELTERLQRLQADFDNFRRRTQEQAGQATAKGRRDLLDALLPTLDNLDQALRHVEDPGLKLIGRQLTETLAQQGVQVVEPEAGAAFDAATQEAIAEEAADGIEKGAIVKVFQRGYVVDGRVVRPARVVVAS